jgi:hypothetical protein
MRKYYYKILLKRVKIRLSLLYYKFLPPIKVDISSLIYPNREDINLRIDFIYNFILKPDSNYKNSSYFQFLKELKKHSYYIKDIDIERHVKKFRKLYFLLKNNNYQPKKYGYVTVERVKINMKFVYPNNGRIVDGMEVTNKYILVEGAHRIAVLKVLGYNEVFVKRTSRHRINSSDYTTFIKTY